MNVYLRKLTNKRKKKEKKPYSQGAMGSQGEHAGEIPLKESKGQRLTQETDHTGETKRKKIKKVVL